MVHYVEFYPRNCYTPDGRRDYCGPQNFGRTVTQLYRNLGNGRFEDVTAAVGLNAARGPGLGILTGDFGSNGWPSFLVANDGAANHLWLNEAKTERPGFQGSRPRLTDWPTLRTAAPRAGMGIAAGDLYGDGGEAVVITNLPNEGFTLFQRQPNGDYTDSTRANRAISHFPAIHRLRRGLAGYRESRTAGHVRRQRSSHCDGGSARRPVSRIASAICCSAIWEKGKVSRTQQPRQARRWSPLGVARAAVFGDVNNDGGTDILVTNNNGPARLLLNVAPERGHWILVQLEGVRSNRSGYGSVVELFRKDGTSLQRWVRATAATCGQRSPSSFRAG